MRDKIIGEAPKTVELPEELFYEIVHFLNVIDPNYVDLSYEKIVGSYHYHKRKAGELRAKLTEFRNDRMA